MKGQGINILAVVVVAAVVAGVAWYKSQSGGVEEGEQAAPAAQETVAGPAQPTTKPADALPGASPTSAPSTAAKVEEKAEEEPTAERSESPKRPRLVDLGADKCIPCKKLAPILEELKKEYAGRLDVVFIDVWKNPEAKAPYRIRVIPTQVLFDGDGNEVWRHEGFISKEDLKKVIAEKVGVK